MTPRTALVTGANRGIGRAIASALKAQGLRVLAAARRDIDAAETAEQLGVTKVTLDLSDPLQVERRATELAEAHGPIDVLVNNAAILPEGYGLSVETEAVVRAMHVNAMSPFALIRVLGPMMKSRGYGRIVNVSSGWGAFDEGLSGPTAYALSKAALNAVTVSAAQALGRRVLVNAACPGWVRTRMGGPGAAKSPEEGADTPVWLATLPDDGPTAGFYRDRRRVEW